jgi:CheY-like chemotaxis protein
MIAKAAQKRVLVVDDSPLSQALLVKTIEREGAFQIVTTDNGTEAIKHVQSGQFDCVFLDLSMPGVTGYDVLEAVGDCGVPIIVVTADRQKRTEERVLDLGAIAVLSKPPQTDKISAVLHGGSNGK